MAFYSVEEVRAQLPRVGDRLIERPIKGKANGICSSAEQPCTVVFVNTDKLWYTVQFDSGYRETFKLPKGEGGG